MKEQAYNFWTKSKLKEILDELSCEYRSSWSKEKLVSALCEQPVEAVLDTLKSAELKELLEELEASSSGNKAARMKRLLGLLTGGEKTTAKPAEKSTPASREDLAFILQGLGFDPNLPRSEYVQIGTYIYPKTAPVKLYWEGVYAEFKHDPSYYYDEYGAPIQERIDAWRLDGEQSDYVEYGGTHWEDTRTGIQAKVTQSWSSLAALMNQCDADQIALADSMTLTLPIGTVTITDLTFAEEWDVGSLEQSTKQESPNTATYTSNVDIDPNELHLVEVPAGSFMMGALSSDDEAEDDEKPRHEVTLSKGMLVSKYACTQRLYESVMGTNPSDFKGSTRPVECVSWCDALLFCNKLSEMEGLEPAYVFPEPFENDDDWSKQVTWNKDANGYRLPTEAEWEYCARGGESHLYSGSNNIDEVAWYSSNSDSKTHPVGQKKANGFGLYDMSGNVWEWVWDSALLDDDYDFTGASMYTSKAQIDPYVDVSSPERVGRGGSWYYDAGDARVSDRSWNDASDRSYYQGFRFLRTP